MASRGVVPIRAGCGGVEVATYYLARSLAQLAHEVTLVADVDAVEFPLGEGLQVVPPDQSTGAFISRLPGRFFKWILQHLTGNLSVAATVHRLVREGRTFDVIHVHGSLCAVVVSSFASCPVVYTEHDATPFSCRYRTFYERGIRRLIYKHVNGTAFRRVDRVVTVFADLAAEIPSRWRVPASKVVCICNGTNVNLFNPHSGDRTRIKDEFGFDRYCLFVGSLVSRKCPDLLLQALAEVEDVPCVVVGEGPMRKKLQRMARQLGIEHRVAMVGSLKPEELGPVYAAADMLVLPSASEGLPLVVMEAMACGIPVVASKVAGIPSIVRDWETGFLVKPGDVGQLAMAIRFVTGDPTLRDRMGENARQIVWQKYPWHAIAAQYAALYEDVRAAHLVERSAISA